MGYKSYHVEERNLFMQDFVVDGIPKEDFARLTSRCSVDAVALEPTVDVLPPMLEVSPAAKVIMTWRDYPSWFKSTTTGGVAKDIRWSLFKILLALPARLLLFDHVYDALSGGELRRTLALGQPFGGPGKCTAGVYLLSLFHTATSYNPEGANVYERGVFKMVAGEEAYLAHLDEIRRLAAGRLFELDVKRHGFAELAAFLGREVPGSDRPLPHPRSKSSWTNDSIFDHNMPAAGRAIAMLVALDILAVVLFRMAVLGMLRFLLALACGAWRKGAKAA